MVKKTYKRFELGSATVMLVILTSTCTHDNVSNVQVSEPFPMIDMAQCEKIAETYDSALNTKAVCIKVPKK